MKHRLTHAVFLLTNNLPNHIYGGIQIGALDLCSGTRNALDDNDDVVFMSRIKRDAFTVEVEV